MMEQKEYIATVENGVLYLPEGVDYFTENNYVVTRGANKTLFLFTEEDWAKYEARFRPIDKSNISRYRFSMFFIAGATEIEKDKDRGITIDDYLWEFVEIPHKGITKVKLVSRVALQCANGAKRGSFLLGPEDESFAIVKI